MTFPDFGKRIPKQRTTKDQLICFSYKKTPTKEQPKGISPLLIMETFFWYHPLYPCSEMWKTITVNCDREVWQQVDLNKSFIMRSPGSNLYDYSTRYISTIKNIFLQGFLFPFNVVRYIHYFPWHRKWIFEKQKLGFGGAKLRSQQDN